MTVSTILEHDVVLKVNSARVMTVHICDNICSDKQSNNWVDLIITYVSLFSAIQMWSLLFQE